MKHTFTLLALCATLSLNAADTPKAAPATAREAVLAIGIEPYGTVSWLGLDGKARTGAGVTETVGITKGLSLTLSEEADNTAHSSIDRGVLGVRYTVPLGARVSLDAGIGLGYDFESRAAFARIPFGGTFYAVKKANFDLGVRAQYALDVSGSAKRGTSDGRAFVGPVFNLRF